MKLLRERTPKFISTWLIKRGFQRLTHIIRQLPKRQSVSEVLDFVYTSDAALIQPWQFREEFEGALNQVQSISPKNILEIGTANGGTLFCWCRLAAEGGKIISIDLPEGRFGGGYPEWKIPIYQSFARKDSALHLIRNDSGSPDTIEQVKKLVSGNMLDVLFLDGDHTYEGVKRDFENFSPFVRPGGLIIFHDIAEHPGSHCDVQRFWNEIKQQYPHQEFINNPSQGKFGIGILNYSAGQK